MSPQAEAWPGSTEPAEGSAPAPKPTLWGAALLIGLTAALALAAAKGRDVALFAVVGTYVILIHEGGHWLAAKLCGIPVRRFMVGLGPGVFSFVLLGTRFEFRAIPLLGFVEPGLRQAPQGEPDAGAMVPASELAPLRARVFFILAGVAANLLAAAAHLWLYYRLDPMAAAVPAPILGPVRPGSAADEAGLREGDRVLSIAGRSPAQPWGRDARVLLDAARSRTPVTVEVSRGSRRDHLSWLPRGITADERLDDSEIYGMGLAPAETWLIAAVVPSTGNFLRAGDEVVSAAFGGEVFSHRSGDSTQAVDWIFEQAAGRPVEVTVRREGRTRTFAVSPLVQEDAPLICLRHEPRLRWVRRDSPAWTAGLRSGDLVLSIAGKPVEDDRQLRDRLYKAPRQPLALELDRDGRRLRVILPPEPFKSGRDRGIPEGRWTEFGRDGLRVSSVSAALAARLPDLAVGDVRSAPGYRRGRLCWLKPDGRELCADYGKFSDLAVRKTIYNPPFRFDIALEPRPRGALACAGDALGICWGLLRNVGGLLRAMFQDAGSLSGPKDPGVVASEMRESPARILFLIALLCCIVAVLNLLPVPPLDGFRFLETLWQAAFGRTPRPGGFSHPNCLGCLGVLVMALLLGAGLFSFLRDLWLAVWR
jgi:RIP metalloprotease RseP